MENNSKRSRLPCAAAHALLTRRIGGTSPMTNIRFSGKSGSRISAHPGLSMRPQAAFHFHLLGFRSCRESSQQYHAYRVLSLVTAHVIPNSSDERHISSRAVKCPLHLNENIASFNTNILDGKRKPGNSATRATQGLDCDRDVSPTRANSHPCDPFARRLQCKQ